MNKIVLIVLAIFMSGCVSNDLQQVSKIVPNEKIVVVAQFGGSFPIKTVGTTAFQNEYFEIDSSDWKTNEFIETEIRNKLSPNYTIVPNSFIRTNLKTPKNDFVSGYPSPIKNKSVLEEAQKINAKYILVISPTEFSDVYFGTNQRFKGNGIYQRRGNSIHYSQISFNLFNAKTGQFIATNGTIGHNGGDSVWITNESFGYKMFSSPEDITASTKEKIKNNNQKLISKLLDRSLEFMKFGVKKHNK
ncbi:hypothetical protein [Pseudoalteromonas prydzensis]|uniref:hypothetical protein n=1 Tax=Pseudoalteromonas prydzensis TaxID=182141 RepID=UPI0007E50A6F|nr:hypothetical protein [Pseudoalteromonas prydzensis]MBE0379380.1 hypothetical protein [Pseudoalteromonas prydzensis ACAM 620]